MTYNSSTKYDSYVPVYDAIPDKWEEAKNFLVERLKEHANAINVRAIGWMLDEELLSGFQFIPPQNISGTSEQNRSVFRKTFNSGALLAGANQIPHGITFDNNFTLVELWCAGTNTGLPLANVITGNDVTMDNTNININSPRAYNRSIINILYTLEL